MSNSVVLIVCDALRARNLPEWGYHRMTAPFLSELADESIVYRKAYSHFNNTTPSVAALLTGLPYTESGIWKFNLSEGGEGATRRVSTIAELLPDDVYSIFLNDVMVNAMDPNGVLWAEFDYVPPEYGDVRPYSTAEQTADAAIASIPNKDKDFFMYVHFWDAHFPWRCDWRKAFEFFSPQENEPPIEVYLSSLSKEGRKNAKEAIPEEVKEIDSVRFLQCWYDAEIRYMDEQIRRFYDALPDDTLIIFTADHGESLGERGYWFVHSEVPLFEEVIHVPLMIKYPTGKWGFPHMTHHVVCENWRLVNLILDSYDDNYVSIPTDDTAHFATRKWHQLDGMIQGSNKIIKTTHGEVTFDLLSDPKEQKFSRV